MFARLRPYHKAIGIQWWIRGLRW